MKIVLYIFSVLLILAGLLPLVKKDYWTFRVFDYPRLQKFILTLSLILVWFTAVYPDLNKVDYALVFILLLLALYLAKQVIPFSPLSPKMVKSASKKRKTSLHVLVGNVYQSNANHEKCNQLIQKEKPDIFMLVETDQDWANAVSMHKVDYPYTIEIPLENTYGMVFYSKFPIVRKEVNYLIDEEIPSIIADIQLPSRQLVRVYGIHPTPPVPGENTHSTERDAEILIVGKMAKSYDRPCIIIGDLNDVAWSYTNNLFLKISGMGDPRRGRGMYSTFHAKYPLFRWPLDHIFLSRHFRLKKLMVHGSIDSDHFPISAQVVLDILNENDQMEADQEDFSEMQEKISKGLDFS